MSSSKLNVQAWQAPVWDSGEAGPSVGFRPQDGGQVRQAPGGDPGEAGSFRDFGPQSGDQDKQAPKRDISNCNAQSKDETGNTSTDMLCHESFDEWANEQAKEHQLGNLVDYELFKEIESARRMEESRMGPHGSSWPQTPASAFRELVYRDYDTSLDLKHYKLDK